MSEPIWKRLAEDIQTERIDGAYKDRVHSRIPSAGRESVAVELVREMASALRRSEEKVTCAIQTLEAQGRKIDALLSKPSSPDPVELRYRIDEHNRQHDAAKKALWELLVHREALGFLRNEDLPALYPIPPRR
ncbi:hypothetical protein [Chondromyces crocatus]|uniref:Uncharacterized protein n=1 Tax=Chondromyces crocatus TaxID=52 RepID=A0A0K1E639_CHOCO|nr:hypothetical protein [Chondromyces crocatus]AKT36340.1 uncharacterized protein CMC5_004540 [Chondromyces crocatus]